VLPHLRSLTRPEARTEISSSSLWFPGFTSPGNLHIVGKPTGLRKDQGKVSERLEEASTLRCCAVTEGTVFYLGCVIDDVAVFLFDAEK